MTEIIRSNLTNVINLCFNIRELIDNIVKCPQINKFVGNGVYIYKKDNKIQKTESEWFKKYISYNNSMDSNIILAWTNKQCNTYNETIRKIMFKHKSVINKYEIGDILILNDFYIMDEIKNTAEKKQDKFYTSEQIKIIDKL